MSPATLPILIFLLVLILALPAPLFVVPWTGLVILLIAWMLRVVADRRLS